MARTDASADAVDLAALVPQKDGLVAQLRQTKYVDVAAAHGFEIRAGEARFDDAETQLVDGSPLRARAYVVATDADPARPPIPGLEDIDFLTSTTAMEQQDLPASLVVIGGGYVGAEQAQLFAHLGTRVTIFGRLAPRAEPELAEVVRGVFADDGITVIEEYATGVERRGDHIAVTATSGTTATGQRLLVATARKPRTVDPDLDAANVDRDHRGFVIVDDTQRSSIPSAFAAEDVTGAPQFVYVAAAAGRVAALNALSTGGPPARVDYRGLPSVIFTRPSSPLPASPSPAPSTPATGASAESCNSTTCPAHWPTTTPAAPSRSSPTPTPASSSVSTPPRRAPAR